MLLLHFVGAADVDVWSLDTIGRWANTLEGFRRLEAAFYLFGILLGLGTIIRVLRFRSIRIRELPDRARSFRSAPRGRHRWPPESRARPRTQKPAPAP